MYDELIKNLRGRSHFLLPHYGEETSYDSDLMKQAADAIEKLSKFNAEIARRVLKLRMEKPRWIPVTERLPGREWVLCKCRANIYEVLSLRDGYWYHDPQHQYMSWFVTHWMPLPMPPKEE